MLDSFFRRGFKVSKCKTLLKLTIPRIKLLRNRREIQIKQMRREIANLLNAGQEASARIRVELIIREEKMMAAQEIVELFCELITARLPIIDAQKECPVDLKEAISSVCFAAPRCADLPELQQVQMLFAGKYGKEFVSSAAELRPECGVNRQLVELLSVRAPSPDVKLKLLKEIAKEHELDWDPSTSENELLKTHEDLLNGPVQFASCPKMPLPEAHNDETKSTTSEPAAAEHTDDSEVDELEESNPSTKIGDPVLKVSTGQAENKQFVPFLRPPSQSSGPFPVKENGSSPSVTKTINDDADLQDVLAAAKAAADTAESAAAAARSASSLAQLRITELVKKKNDDFSCSEAENPFHLEKTESDLQEEDELDAENPFAHSNTPYTSPDRKSTSEHYMANQTTNLHTYDDTKGRFDSYTQSDEDDAFNYGSVNKPQTLSSMDDDAYFSYPDLFTSQGSK